MGIPISKYIDITTRVIQSNSGVRNFSGLIVSSQTMKEYTGTGTDPNAKLREDYAAGKVISIGKDVFAVLFGGSAEGSETDLELAGYKYYANSANGTLNLAYATGTAYESTYNTITSAFQNFGSIMFLGANPLDLVTVGQAVGKDGYALMIGVTATNEEDVSEAFSGLAGCHIYLSTLSYGAVVPMAWYASVNYNNVNASSSIDYKELGEDATVTDGPTKDTYDSHRVNYVGQVQVHGIGRKFYQTGINTDGVDLGVYRDSVWIKSQVEIGWFDLVGSATKIPANAKGLGLVRAMLTDVANDGVTNGVILLNKPLDDAQAQLVNLEANDSLASTQVETSGYYISLRLVDEGAKKVCQYVLVYAKGDHINKVSGVHVLV